MRFAIIILLLSSGFIASSQLQFKPIENLELGAKTYFTPFEHKGTVYAYTGAGLYAYKNKKFQNYPLNTDSLQGFYAYKIVSDDNTVLMLGYLIVDHVYRRPAVAISSDNMQTWQVRILSNIIDIYILESPYFPIKHVAFKNNTLYLLAQKNSDFSLTLFKSTDLGQSFSEIIIPNVKDTEKLYFSGNTLFIHTNGSNGYQYYTFDGSILSLINSTDLPTGALIWEKIIDRGQYLYALARLTNGNFQFFRHDKLLNRWFLLTSPDKGFSVPVILDTLAGADNEMYHAVLIERSDRWLLFTGESGADTNTVYTSADAGQTWARYSNFRSTRLVKLYGSADDYLVYIVPWGNPNFFDRSNQLYFFNPEVFDYEEVPGIVNRDATGYCFVNGVLLYKNTYSDDFGKTFKEIGNTEPPSSIRTNYIKDNYGYYRIDANQPLIFSYCFDFTGPVTVDTRKVFKFDPVSRSWLKLNDTTSLVFTKDQDVNCGSHPYIIKQFNNEYYLLFANRLLYKSVNGNWQLVMNLGKYQDFYIIGDTIFLLRDNYFLQGKKMDGTTLPDQGRFHPSLGINSGDYIQYLKDSTFVLFRYYDNRDYLLANEFYFASNREQGFYDHAFDFELDAFHMVFSEDYFHAWEGTETLDKTLNIINPQTGEIKKITTNLPFAMDITDIGYTPEKRVVVTSSNGGIWVSENYANSVEEPAYSSHSTALLLYPNPAHTTLHLRFPQQEQGDYTVRIFDIHGRQVVQVADQHTLNIETFLPGFYLLSVVLEDGSAIQGKFMKN